MGQCVLSLTMMMMMMIYDDVVYNLLFALALLLYLHYVTYMYFACFTLR